MKAAAIVAIVMIIGSLMLAVRSGSDSPLPQALPFMGGRDRPPLFEFAGLCLLGITWWGYQRMRNNKKD